MSVIPPAPMSRMYRRWLFIFALAIGTWAAPSPFDWVCAIASGLFGARSYIKTWNEAVLACDAVWARGVERYAAKQQEAEAIARAASMN